MSQVGVSRPGSQFNGKIGLLPEIQHPLSRMSNPGNMDVRGVSRAGERPSSQPSGRPLASETAYPVRKSLSAIGRESRQSSRGEGVARQSVNIPIGSIPEGVEVAYGDPEKTRIPIFGNRAATADRQDVSSRASSRLSRPSTQARIEIDEIEALLKEKVKTSFYEVRKRFKDNDPEGRGNVSREAFARILTMILGRPMTQCQFTRLMDRVGFRERQIISFSEFFTNYRHIPDANYPQWMDPVNRPGCNDRITMNANEVHLQLKERAKQRFLDVADMFPQMNPGGTGRILKPELKQLLNKMLYFMSDSEFEELWKRYDPNGEGVIRGSRFLKELGIEWRNGSLEMERSSPVREGRSPRRKEKERQNQIDIEIWLKEKFREGFFNMKAEFEKKDSEMKGIVSFDEFIEVLGRFGLKLEKSLLGTFLSRCSIHAMGKGVPYREFLHRFQDRSESGMVHQILTDPRHRYNRPDVIEDGTSITAIESQLMNMFQRDFLALLGTFKNIDKLGQDVISQEEFRAALESRFDMPLTDPQFRSFMDRVPLDEDGNVKYVQFMQFFDTKGKAQSLFEERPNKVVETSDYPPLKQCESPLLEDDELEVGALDEETSRRSTNELFKLIKGLLKKHYQDIEDTFYSLDETNTRRITPEMMYQMFKRFDINPEITRGEIRDLWNTFITNADRTLDYYQFVRHFGFSMRSAAFPNAKLNPPRRGDCDFMMRSRKLNCDSDMLEDSLRSKVEFMWDDLQREFLNMDPYTTGFVTKEEFKDVLSELCIHLTDWELEGLCERFALKKDGRISYIEFLKPFAQRKKIWRHGNNMLSLLQHPQPELPISDIVEPPQQGLTGLTAKLRQKLAGDWKNLRRAFRKLDVTGDGYLSLPEFRSVLKLANVVLDEDEVYQVMSEFDRDMSGKIPYHKFMEEALRTESRKSDKKTAA
ncbi:EF-hand calcium-binding domain-containing protein 6-like [Gigantopelta aegis]|uniref:EF-hand calcium-binding domain-containing protein 6-like n=1 Tax=Gigantopelta aegis TaxID=1735272 RepID=UPI001B887449|nr:EF-hand calcium-binding domain-containing protein 6-like [Gigantopelta aegis]